MDTSRGVILTCWGYLGHSWGVSRSYFRTVLIYTFNCYWRWSPDILLIWREGDGTIWIDGVDTDVWHSLSARTIFEGHWLAIIHWYQWIAFGKGWRTFLWLTLDTARLCISASWRYSRYGWRVLSSHFRTVLVDTFHNYWVWGTNVLFIWCESDGAIWIDGVDADTLYCLSRLTILESHRTIQIDWHFRITWWEGWRSLLWLALYTFWGIIRASRRYLGYSWSVGRGYFGTVLVHTLNSDWVWCADILFVWREGNRTIRLNDISPNIWYFLSAWTIFESHWLRVIKWNKWVTSSEGWCPFLWLTLNTVRFSVGASWRYLGHCRRISSSHWCTVLINSSNRYGVWSTNILFLWCEGDGTVWVDRVFTDIRNRLSAWTIFEGHRFRIIKWY